MSLLTLTCEYLLLDASSMISLYASRRLREIIESLPVKAAIVDLVRQKEVRYIWGGPVPDVRQHMEPIDLQPLIDRQFITEISLSDDEYTTMVNLAAYNLDNGECASAAVAFHRGWGVCTDDFEALPRLRRAAPNIPFTITSQLLRYWSTAMKVSEEDIRAVVRSMQLRAGYNLSKKDTEMAWLEPYLKD